MSWLLLKFQNKTKSNWHRLEVNFSNFRNFSKTFLKFVISKWPFSRQSDLKSQNKSRKWKLHLTGKVSCIKLIFWFRQIFNSIFLLWEKKRERVVGGYCTFADYLLNQHLQANELILDHFDTLQVLN